MSSILVGPTEAQAEFVFGLLLITNQTQIQG